jgi:hypothetical protein
MVLMKRRSSAAVGTSKRGKMGNVMPANVGVEKRKRRGQIRVDTGRGTISRPQSRPLAEPYLGLYLGP